MDNNSNNKQVCEAAERLTADGRLDEALKILDEAIKASDDAELHYQRGRLLWKMGRKTDAMTDYATASELDPSSPATAALEMAREIMNFYHRDRYNP
ncbi:MAG: tetratricopeptide repeat protein [Muribaculaceae bacterium]|nr:tetratricopeptide repeat protein [Muribaculaceae bacterium]